MNIVLMGAPGSGKGTQAQRLASRLRIPHISTGHMLRREISSGTSLSIQVRGLVERGEYVPDAVITDLALRRLNQPDALFGFILDGYPRTVGQAESLDGALAESGRGELVVLDIVVPADVLLERLLGRAAEEHRADDAPVIIRTRLEIYERLTLPVLAYYRACGRLVEVDGTRGVQCVSSQIDTVVGKATGE